MKPPDPWRLADRLGVNIRYVHLSTARGYNNGHDTVWLSKQLTIIEARCTLYHELVHIMLGHRRCQPPRTELHVRYTVARDLIPWPNLLDAVGEDLTPHHIADALNVTTHVLRDRIDAATAKELQHLRRRTACTESAA